MSSVIPIYAFFSVLALVSKVLIFWWMRHSINLANRYFITLLLALFGVNILELVGFYYPPGGGFATPLLKIYYAFVIVMASAFCMLSAGIAEKVYKKNSYFLAGVYLAILIMILFTDLVIAGSEHIGYTFTRVPGDFYWVFQVGLVVPLLAGLAFLVIGFKFESNVGVKRRCKALLFSFLPIILVSVSVVFLMQIGFQLTASVVGSFAILIFVIVFAATEKEHKLFEFLSHVPATEEYYLVNKVRNLVYSLEEGSMQSSMVEFEKMLIKNALLKTDGNKKQAAEMLGISRATLRRKLNG